MTKYTVLFLVSYFLFSCQKEEFTIVDEQDESSFIQDMELTGLMLSVASHDGGFDNVIDGSDCFSIDFPYTILLNGEEIIVKSVNDLLVLNDEDDIVPTFPITITFANYLKATVTSNEALSELVEQCVNGILYNNRITCVDFLYPIDVATFNTETNDFDTISFDHDKDTFITILNFTSNTLASIQYPIEIQLIDDAVITITNDNELKTFLKERFATCN